ncbi:hypothetical protein CF8_2044 [Nocardioides sp. CF8]|nr:hypothetical protein CF8_2044 [Nocardioides sp. CF8]
MGATLGLAVSVVAIDSGLYFGQEQREVVAEAQHPTAEALVVAYDCWSGEAPADMAGQFPRRVVVTVGGEVRYAGERMVGKALDQIFDGANHGLTVHGFCR